MRNRRRGPARLSAVSAPVSASARAEAISGAFVPASPCRARGVCLSRGALFCSAALANEHAGGTSELRPRCRGPAAPGNAMSEAALAPSHSERAPLASARARRNRLNSLEALERGFALFRSTFAREAWRYYVGTAPLVVCFIPMWVINGQIRISDGALLTEA